MIRQKADRKAAGKDSQFTLRKRPVNFEKIDQYCNVPSKRLIAPDQDNVKDLVCRTPPSMAPPMPVFEVWRVPEKLLRDVDVYVRGSFESGAWYLPAGDSEGIIRSPLQEEEENSLDTFTGTINLGCVAFELGAHEEAVYQWRRCFEMVGGLIHGRYHDILPCVLQKINYLTSRGCPEVAMQLKNYIAHFRKSHRPGDLSTTSIYQSFEQLTLEDMMDIEVSIMNHFIKLLALYAGQLSEDSFHIWIAAAGRRLQRNRITSLEECLPDLSRLDTVFGRSSYRSLRVVYTRVYIMFKREWYEQAENEAYSLVQRAQLIDSYDWKRPLYLAHGWYYIGISQLEQRIWGKALLSLRQTLPYLEEYRRFDHTGLSEPYRYSVQRILANYSEEASEPPIDGNDP